MSERNFVTSAAAGVLVVLTLTFGSTPVFAQATPATTLSKMIVFGASNTDPGNAFILSGGAAAGPPYYQGRFTNGPNWIDRLAQRVGLPTPLPFVVGGTNFSVGGAETGDGDSATCVGTTCAPNVGRQIEFFFAGSGTLNGDELIVLHAGGNDAGRFVGLNNAHTAATNMANHVETLALAGGQNFVVANLESIGQNPGFLGTRYEVSTDAWVMVFNMILETRLTQLEINLGITMVQLDIATLDEAMRQSPASFGLTNVTDPACPGCGAGFPAPDAASTMVPNPEEYRYWDFGHPTTVVHQLIGDAAAEGVEQALGIQLLL